MHQAQGAQAFDQRQLARREIMEFLITIDQLGKLAEAFVALAGRLRRR